MTPAAPSRGWQRTVLGALCAGVVAGAAYRAGALTGGGAVAAVVVGTGIFGRGGPRDTAALLAFFVTSSALSRLPGRTRPAAAESRRNERQVVANGGVAAGLAALSRTRHQWSIAARAGALAAASADTWATEVGVRWGGRPRSIVSGAPLTPGESGGVTLLGTLTGFGGALLVGVVGAGVNRLGVAAAGAGIAGLLTDSVLGATVQARYWCSECGTESERPVHPGGHRLVRSRGLPGVDNDVVNLLATVTGAATGGLLSRLLGGRGTIE